MRPHYMTHLANAAALLATLVSTSALADSLAYVNASSQMDQGTNPGRFAPANLIDHDPTTLWCEGAANDGHGESVQFVFKQPEVINRVTIAAAAGSGRFVESVRISDGTSEVHVDLDGSGKTDQMFATPLRGTHYTVTLEHLGATNPNSIYSGSVACLADVALFFNQQEATAAAPTSTTASKLNLVGGWGGAPLGAPESFITFAMDGSWHWSHVRLGAETPDKEQSGTYKVDGDKLLMRRGKRGTWVEMSVQVQRVTIDPLDLGAPNGDYDVIVLGEGLGKTLSGTYNNAKF